MHLIFVVAHKRALTVFLSRKFLRKQCRAQNETRTHGMRPARPSAYVGGGSPPSSLRLLVRRVLFFVLPLSFTTRRRTGSRSLPKKRPVRGPSQSPSNTRRSKKNRKNIHTMSWWWSFLVIPDDYYHQHPHEMQVRTLPLMHHQNPANGQQQFRTLPASYVVAAPEQRCYYGIVSD